MKFVWVLAASLVIATPAEASGSLFAKLVEATKDSNWDALKQLLEMETLSTSTVSVGLDDILIAGPMRHGVSAAEITGKLTNCMIGGWADEGVEWVKPYVFWQCPTKRIAEND